MLVGADGSGAQDVGEQLGEPGDFVGTAVYLVSELSLSVTGARIPVW